MTHAYLELSPPIGRGLTNPRALVAGLGLPQESSVEAVLADGRPDALETSGCFFDWFGGTYQIQVVASDGAYPLLGTQRLSDRRLAVDYAAMFQVATTNRAGERLVTH